jgi:hypothetical protein
VRRVLHVSRIVAAMHLDAVLCVALINVHFNVGIAVL